MAWPDTAVTTLDTIGRRLIQSAQTMLAAERLQGNLEEVDALAEVHPRVAKIDCQRLAGEDVKAICLRQIFSFAGEPVCVRELGEQFVQAVGGGDVAHGRFSPIPKPPPLRRAVRLPLVPGNLQKENVAVVQVGEERGVDEAVEPEGVESDPGDALI